MVRMPKAYPVYDDVYRDNVEVIRRWFEEHAPNVHPVGRNGMHKYNNQDHSMYTAMLTVENIHGAHHDIWSVNVEEEYHESTDGASEAPRSHRARRSDHPPECHPGRLQFGKHEQEPVRQPVRIRRRPGGRNGCQHGDGHHRWEPGRGQGPERRRLVRGGTEQPPGPWRSFPWWMTGISAVGLGLRLIYVFVVKAGAALQGDAYYYHWQAQLNTEGHWFVDPTVFFAKHPVAALIPSAQTHRCSPCS